ncbi:MAG: hypothetical protein KAJ73_03430 [Zetaproteobacteria bacterium]|nr:hypothetical protein [Zetaproteobacteria bacterium]
MRLYKFIVAQLWIDINEIEAMFNTGRSLEIHLKSGKEHLVSDRQDIDRFLKVIREKHTVAPGGNND